MDLEPLRALLVLMREHGVVQYQSGDLTLRLDPAALPRAHQEPQDAPQDAWDASAPTGLTPEQLMFYSAGQGLQNDGDEEPA